MRRVIVAVTVAVLLTMLASSAAYARPSEWYTVTYHTVKPGETLFSIGRLYGVSPAAIASHNGIVNPNLIYAWQVLAIPNAYGWGGPWWGWYPYGCACRYHHTVAGGENLYRISLHYGVTMWRIAQCNHITNLNYVQYGRTLCIP